MSRTMKAMARLAKVRQDLAMARAKNMAGEYIRAKSLNDQVVQFAGEYGESAMASASTVQGVNAALLQDTMAFRGRLLDTAKEQEILASTLHRKVQEANRLALAAKMKAEGFDRIVARQLKEQQAKQQQAEWRSIEDNIMGRAARSRSSGTKDA